MDNGDHYSMEAMDFAWENSMSEKLGIANSESSFLGSGTDFAMTEKSNNWMMIRHRTNSSESGRTDVSDGACLSTPSKSMPEWPYTTYTGTGELVEEPSAQPMCGNQLLFLQDLTSTSVPSVYHTAASGSDNLNRENDLIWPNVLHVASNLPSRTPNEESWNPLEHRVPCFTPAYTAFAPDSPPESVIEGSGDEPKSPVDSKPRTTRKKPQVKKAPAKGIKPKGISWQHTIVSQGGLQSVLDVPAVEPSRNQRTSGVRTRALDPEAKEKARKIRKLKACWACWVLKVPCSVGDTCDRCRRNYSRRSPSTDQLCSRAGFVDYEDIFFPAYLHSHLARQKIEDLINDHTSGFTDTAFEVAVSTGTSFQPMKLFANLFRPLDGELLQVHQISIEAYEDKSQLVSRYSAPVGLMALSTAVLKKQCKEHVESMIDDPGYALQITAGDDTRVPYLLLTEIGKYCNVSNSLLLRSAMMLHACQYFMGALITFSNESALQVHQTVQPFGAPLEPFLSSRLLSRQIKYVMHKLHREITKDVLDGLEKSMRQRTKDSWGVSFCAILLMCLCIESLQTAAESFIVCDINQSKSEGVECQYSREQSLVACQALHNYPFHQCTRLFHEIYRSHKESTGARDGGFNPFRSMHSGEATGLDKGSEEMARSIDWISRTSREAFQCRLESAANKIDSELVNLSLKPSFIDSPFVQPSDIKTNNIGRLVAAFLNSFIPSGSSLPI